jgi:hypothetical protein
MNAQPDSNNDTPGKQLLRIARLCAALSVAQFILWVGALVNAAAPAIAPRVVIGAASIAALVFAGFRLAATRRKEAGAGCVRPAETGAHDGTA